MVTGERPGGVPLVMTIAGSDSGGGAGIQADLKTFAAFGVFGTSAVTAITAQNTLGVTAVQAIDLTIIEAQIEAIISDIGVDAVKIGMLASTEIVALVALKLREYGLVNVVVDPVMVATSGDRLLQDSAVESLSKLLIPLATVVTPNLDEVQALTGRRVESLDDMKRAARQIHKMGAQNVLVKGGRFVEGRMLDVLYDGESLTVFSDELIETTSTHGTGCTLSSAIAAGLAHGRPVTEAIADAKAYLTETLRRAFLIGAGHGPVNHLFGWWAQGGADGKGGATHSVTREPG